MRRLAPAAVVGGHVPFVVDLCTDDQNDEGRRAFTGEQRLAVMMIASAIRRVPPHGLLCGDQ